MILLLFVCGLLMLIVGALFMVLPTAAAGRAMTTVGHQPPPINPADAESDRLWAWLIGVALIGVGTFLMLLGLVV